MPEKETRTIVIEDIELRAADDEGDAPTISGYGAVYHSASLDLGGFREVIDPSAFERTLKGRGEVRSFFNHDPSKPLASLKAGNLTLKSDDRGLFYEIKPPKTTYAADVVEAVRAKLVRGSSFSFLTRTDSWHEEKGIQVRTLLDVDLLEVGPVTVPAYEKTTSQVRSMLEARGLTLDGERAEQAVDVDSENVRSAYAHAGIDLQLITAILVARQRSTETGWVWTLTNEHVRALKSAGSSLLVISDARDNFPSYGEDEPPPAEEPPPHHRLALARRRFETQRKLYAKYGI